MHVKKDFNRREGDRYASLEQLQLAITLESASKQDEEDHRSDSSTSRCGCLLPCSSSDHCPTRARNNPAKKNNAGNLPALHAVLLEAAGNRPGERHTSTSLALVEKCLRNGADVNSEDERGETALTYVKLLLHHGHFLLACQAAGLLLKQGACVDAEDGSRQTLLCHSVAYLDQAIDLTRLLLNYGAQVWHGTDVNGNQGHSAVHHGESPFSMFLQAVVRCRCIDGGVLTANLLGRTMGSRPEAMRSLIVRSMVRHGRFIRVLGPVFTQLKSILSPYWKQPPALRYAAWRAVRQSIQPQRLVNELEQLGLPPSLRRYISMTD